MKLLICHEGGKQNISKLKKQYLLYIKSKRFQKDSQKIQNNT